MPSRSPKSKPLPSPPRSASSGTITPSTTSSWSSPDGFMHGSGMRQRNVGGWTSRLLDDLDAREDAGDAVDRRRGLPVGVDQLARIDDLVGLGFGGRGRAAAGRRGHVRRLARII